jgi:hypothetical protein
MPLDLDSHEQRAQLRSRFNAVVAYCNLTLRELAAQLGYAGVSTLYKIRACQCFPNSQRIARLSTIEVYAGVRISIDWIFTGEYGPFLVTSRATTTFTTWQLVEQMNAGFARRYKDLCYPAHLSEVALGQTGVPTRNLAGAPGSHVRPGQLLEDGSSPQNSRSADRPTPEVVQEVAPKRLWVLVRSDFLKKLARQLPPPQPSPFEKLVEELDAAQASTNALRASINFDPRVGALHR